MEEGRLATSKRGLKLTKAVITLYLSSAKKEQVENYGMWCTRKIKFVYHIP